MGQEPDLVWTRREGARKAKMGLSAFDEALRRGDFPSLRVGRKVLIPAQAFARVLAGEKT